jgi:type VII secretion protein EccB
MNLTSALLLLRQPGGAQTVSVSRTDLATRQRGLEFGIPGAPDDLPPAENLVSGPWTACSQARLDEARVSRPEVTLHIDYPPPTSPIGLGPGNALAVRDTTTGKKYLVSEGRRFLVPDDSLLSMLPAASSSRTVAVGGAWLNTLDQGQDFAAISIPHQDSPGPLIDGRPTHVGQLFQLRNDQFYVLLDDGLSPVHALGEALVQATTGQRVATPLSTAGLKQGGTSRATHVDAELPSGIPVLAPTDGTQIAVCATWTNPSSNARPTLVALPAAPSPDGVPVPVGVGGAGEADPAQRVAVPPNHALIVQPCSGTCTIGREPYLITETGRAFPLGSTEVLDFLGYGKVKPTPVRTEILRLLPQGPALVVGAGQSTTPPKGPTGALGTVTHAPPIG